jgi:CHAD domain-containing protein
MPTHTTAAALARLNGHIDQVQNYLSRSVKRKRPPVEVLHQLRVSVRRTLAALSLFKPILPDVAAKKVRKKLAKFMRAAGKVRDIDVFSRRIAGEKHAHLKSLLRRLHRQRDKSVGQLRSLYKRLNRNNRLQNQIEELLRKKLDSCLDSKRLAEWLNTFWPDLVESYCITAETSSFELKRLHRFRILTKKIRYTLEILRPNLPRQDFSDAYGMLEQLQDRLGQLCDHVVARDTFRKWKEKHIGAISRRYLAQLHLNEAEVIRQQVEEFRAWWTQQRQSEMRATFNRLAPLSDSWNNEC